MSIFKSAVITRINKPVTVFFEKGRKNAIRSRRWYGLSLCLSGQITYTQGDNLYTSHPNNVIIFPKNASYSLHGNKEGVFHVINFDCSDVNIDEITVLPIKDSALYIKDFHLLTNAFLYDKKPRQFQLLYGILERLESEQAHSPLSLIISYLETHFSDNDLTNEFLAKKMGISEVYLRKLFLSNLGVTPKQYVLNLRIKAAQQLLISTSNSITEISEKCGFASVYHFCRIFKQKTSFTPSEYSAKNRVYEI